MTDIQIAAKLSQLRNAKGTTQYDVAKALGVSNKTVSKWENGISAPDLAMLVALAKYYGVSTDVLLGLPCLEKSITGAFSTAFSGLGRNEVVLKIFEIIDEIFSSAVNNPNQPIDKIINKETSPIPPDLNRLPRMSISLNEFFGFTVRSENVNLSVMQWQNRADFVWLLNPQNQDKIIELLKFLADREVLQVMYFIHNANYSKHFTADYAARHTGVGLDRIIEILETCCELGLCTKSTAHLKDGETYIYESFGDGLLLSIISIAYEKLCGSNRYEYCYGNSDKMIGGAKQ